MDTSVHPRLRAFLIHLGITALPVLVVCTLVFLAWYPSPYLEIAGVAKEVLLMVGLVVGLGPLLTLAIYRPGKWGLKFDLVVIGLVQACALAYTTWAIYEKRPLYAVFVVDRFNVIAADDETFQGPVGQSLESFTWSGPSMVVASLPENQQEYEALVNEILFQGKPDIQYRPRYWSPYSERLDEVMNAARSLASLKAARPEAAGDIEAIAGASDWPMDQLVYWPVLGRNRDYAMVINRSDGGIEGLVAVDPWLEDIVEP